MALEAVVYPHDLFNYGCKDLYSMGGGGGGGGWSYDLGVKEEERMGCSGGGGGESLEKNIEEGHHLIGYGDSSSSSIMLQNVKELDTNSSADGCTKSSVNIEGASTTTSGSGRRKRRRTKSCKNKEEVENQRMTHIVVERNRRKQMNEYLSVLRSLMPPSYVQRSDQASIVGGAINFVKELEQLLQSLEAQKRTKHQSDSSFSSPFAEFFTSPQYPSCSTHSNNSATMNESVGENRSLIADIKVTMVESHANLKVLTKRHPKQLWKMVAGFQGLRLTILHLNVTTVDDMVLYSFSIKIEDECQLTTVDEIATAVHEMLDRIQVEVGVL